MPNHEKVSFEIAKGFKNIKHISYSTSLSQTIKFLDRASTTVLDAYITPVLKSFIQKIRDQMP